MTERVYNVGSGARQRRITVYYDPKPGRLDGADPYYNDFEAWDLENYCGEPGDPVGHGSTAENAILELMERLEERDDGRLPTDRQDRAPGEVVTTELGSMRK